MSDALATLRLDDVAVAESVDGSGLPDHLGPRPHLHPVRTLGGIVVTDALPADHPWHLGLSVALQDVDGWNFWGGPTFVRGQGYVRRDDHGRIEQSGIAEVSDHGFSQALRWLTAHGGALLDEHRRVRARPAGKGWELAVTTTLTNTTDRALRLGSPATNGRPGAGYGGLFWRLPPTDAARVFTDVAAAEQDAHDSVAPWLAWIDEDCGFTLVLAGADEATRADPWFVRIEDYPGLGSQIAAREPVVLPAGGAVTRGLRALVVDGELSVEDARAWVDAAMEVRPPRPADRCADGEFRV